MTRPKGLGAWRQHARFALGYPRYLRRRLELESARAEIRRRRKERTESVVRWVREVVYGRRRTPYVQLLRWAGCELGDFEQLVSREGLEEALRRLRAAGVWVAYEEFKGRRPIERGSQRLDVRPGEFDNPLLRGGLSRASGGSTGPGTRVMIDLDYLWSRGVNQLVVEHLKGTLGVPTLWWRGVLPDAGLTSLLSAIPYGGQPEKWFSPVSFADTGAPWSMRLAHHYCLGVARLLGVRVPSPETVPIHEAGRVARWAADRLRESDRVVVRASVSRLVRVASAAREAGLDLTGATLAGGGEPPTEAKVAEIRRSGARYEPGYVFSEGGSVGPGCLNPVGVNDVHFFDDRLVLIQHDRRIGDVTVPAFLFTSLLDVTPKLLLNVESDDYGVIETRSCGCPLEAEGWTTHIRDIRSFSKLTSGGMTLIGSQALHVLEEVLPKRFEASATDFQLREHEEAGETRLDLVASPRVSGSDAEILEAFFEGLRGGDPAAALARAVWSQSGSLRVIRAEPRWTARGKLLPLDLERRGSAERRV